MILGTRELALKGRCYSIGAKESVLESCNYGFIMMNPRILLPSEFLFEIFLSLEKFRYKMTS